MINGRCINDNLDRTLMWKIYYGDGNTFSSQDSTAWMILKRNNVQVIVQEDDNHGWFTQAQTDYYVWDNRGGGGWRWWGVDIFGLYDYLLEPGEKCVLFGRTIEKDEFSEIFKRASEDTDFPKKTSFANKERK